MRCSAFLLALLCSCGDAGEGRRQWLQTTLVLDNQVFLDTDADLARGKFAKMRRSLHTFLRGTVGQWARDVGTPGGEGYWPSAYTTPAAAEIALVGDPHVENIGSFRGADGRLVADFNDFDAATFGPYHFDVRRLALSFHVAAIELGVAELAGPAATAVAAAYAEEVEVLAAGGGPDAVVAGDAHGAVLKDMFDKAAEDGAIREELLDYTRVESGDARAMYFGQVEPGQVVAMGEFREPVAEDETAPPGVEDLELASQILARYPACLEAPVPAEQLALKGLSRRFGAGVASYPVLRLYALVEGPTAAANDDVLLEIKEVFDAAPFPGLTRLPSQAFGNDAARVVAMQRAMQTTRLDDPLLGCARVGDRSFRVRDRTKYQRGLDLVRIGEKLGEGELVGADLLVLADRSGRLLARSHARAPRRDGTPAAPAIAGAIGGDSAGFVAETVEFTVAYFEVLTGDYALFVELLEVVGPSLGYAPALSSTPEP